MSDNLSFHSFRRLPKGAGAPLSGTQLAGQLRKLAALSTLYSLVLPPIRDHGETPTSITLSGYRSCQFFQRSALCSHVYLQSSLRPYLVGFARQWQDFWVGRHSNHFAFLLRINFRIFCLCPIR